MSIARKADLELKGFGVQLDIAATGASGMFAVAADDVQRAIKNLRFAFSRTPDEHQIEVGSHLETGNGALRQPVIGGVVFANTAYKRP